MLDTRGTLPFDKLWGLNGRWHLMRLGRWGEPLGSGNMVIRETKVADQHPSSLDDLAGSPTLVYLPFWRLPLQGAVQDATVAYISCQGGKQTWSYLAQNFMFQPSLLCSFIPSVKLWKQTFSTASRCIKKNEPLTLECLQIFLWCGTLNLNLLAFRFNNKLDRFVSWIRDCIECAGDSLGSDFLNLCLPSIAAFSLPVVQYKG